MRHELGEQTVFGDSQLLDYVILGGLCSIRNNDVTMLELLPVSASVTTGTKSALSGAC